MPSSNSTQKNFCRFGVSWEGCPLPIMCHPELILRGVSSLNRGGGMTLLELYPKTKTEEMSHFVRHDTIKSLFLGLVGKGSFSPSQ